MAYRYRNMVYKYTHLDLTTSVSTRRDALKQIAKLGQTLTEARTVTWENYASWCGALNRGFNGTNDHNRVPIWYTHTGPYFRDEQWADEVLPRRIGHRGWYTEDEHFGEVARGLVARLPHGRYLAGYYWSCNGERVYFGEVYTSAAEAAKDADRHAEIFAEQSRDAFEEDQRQQREAEEAEQRAIDEFERD